MGYIGRIHYEASRTIPGLEVVAATDSHVERVRERYPELQVLPSYQQLLEMDDLDAIVICVPTFLHERFVLEAVAKGFHVLCEKPLALDFSSASRILAAAKQAGVVFTVSQVLRFWPQYARIKELISQGAIGRILSVRAHRLATAPKWAEWFRDGAKSGGCLFDLQVHDLDFVFWILGMPREIQTLGLKSTGGCWDHVHTLLRYEDDVVASIESSYAMPESWPLSAGIRVIGSAGAVEYDFRSAGDVATRSQSVSPGLLYSADGRVEELAANGPDMFAAQLQHFAECIRSKDTPRVCPTQDSHDVMALLDASRQSAETGKPIQFGAST